MTATALTSTSTRATIGELRWVTCTPYTEAGRRSHSGCSRVAGSGRRGTPGCLARCPYRAYSRVNDQVLRMVLTRCSASEVSPMTAQLRRILLLPASVFLWSIAGADQPADFVVPEA